MSKEATYTGIMRYVLMLRNPHITAQDYQRAGFWLEGSKDPAPDLVHRQDLDEDGYRNTLVALTPVGEAHLALLQKAERIYKRLHGFVLHTLPIPGFAEVTTATMLQDKFWALFGNKDFNWDAWLEETNAQQEIWTAEITERAKANIRRYTERKEAREIPEEPLG